MDSVVVYCTDSSELAEYEAVNRGYRGDVYVKVVAQYYLLNIYDIVRLQQDFETELEDYGVYSSESNLILVREVNSREIKKTVLNLFKQSYFENIKPIESEGVQKLNLMEM